MRDWDFPRLIVQVSLPAHAESAFSVATRADFLPARVRLRLSEPTHAGFMPAHEGIVALSPWILLFHAIFRCSVPACACGIYKTSSWIVIFRAYFTLIFERNSCMSVHNNCCTCLFYNEFHSLSKKD